MSVVLRIRQLFKSSSLEIGQFLGTLYHNGINQVRNMVVTRCLP